jgi:hypothetical protein
VQVDNPLDAAPFLPQLLPGLEKVSNEVADPECRSVAARAAKELVRVANEGKTGVFVWALLLGHMERGAIVLWQVPGMSYICDRQQPCLAVQHSLLHTALQTCCTGPFADVVFTVFLTAVPPRKADPVAVAAALKELIAARAPKVASCEVFTSTLAYVAGLCSALQDTKNFEFDEWNGVASTPYLASFMPEAEAEAVTRAYLVSSNQV